MGCTKGDDCKFLHPKLCRNSVLKRYCPNKDCTFHHLKHTRRPREQSEGANRDNPKPGYDASKPSRTFPKFRWDSVSTLNDTPVPPTIQKRDSVTVSVTGNQPRRATTKNANQNEDFLLQLLENMKEGIVLQMSEKLSEFQASIPELVREQVRMTRPTVPAYPLYPPIHQQLVHPPAIQQTAPRHNFLNQYAGCSY